MSGAISHEVGLASKLITKTMTKLNNAGALLVALAFALIITAMFQPFYKADRTYAVFGTDNTSGTVGCLGGCPVTNKNCIGDDSPMECQIVQAFFILAALFCGLAVFSWITDISIFSGNIFGKFPFIGVVESNLRTFAVKVSGGFGGSAASLVCLIIAMVVATTTTINVNGKNTTLVDETANGSAVKYDIGFNLAIGAIFALILASFIGSKSITDFKILKHSFGKMRR
jgi:hypothetical protein